MKKDKKNIIETIPEGGKVKVSHEKGSVGEFIELLKEFPADSKIDLNGNIHISKDDTGATIYPQDPNYRNNACDGCSDDECCNIEPLDSEESIEDARKSFASYVMEKYNSGFACTCPEMISDLRFDSADKVLGAPIMKPNTGTLEYEENYLLPDQRKMIDEIRHHNVYMAECMAEMCRRGISAMLEYNTQVLSHFAHATSKDMCRIVDNGFAGKVLECINDDEEF